MRNLLIITLLFLPLTSEAAITLVQQKNITNTTANTTIVVTLDATPTVGNMLIGFFTESNGGCSVHDISETNVTWQIVASSTVGKSTDIWRGNVSVASPGTTVTANLTCTKSPSGQGYVSEWSGLQTSAATTTDVDTQSATSDGTATTLTTPTLTTTNANDLIVAYARASTGSATTTNASNSFIDFVTATNNATLGAYQIVSTTGSYSTSWGMTSNVVASGVASAAFKGLATTASLPGSPRTFWAGFSAWASMSFW